VYRCRILMRNGLIFWLSYKQLRKYQTSNVNLKYHVVLFQRRCSKPQMCKENNNCVDGYEWFVPAYQFQKQFKEDIIIQFIGRGDNNQFWKYLKRRTKRYLWIFLDVVQIYSKNIWIKMIVKHKVVINAIVLKHSGLKLDMWFYNGDINRDRYFMPHRLTLKNTFPYLFKKIRQPI
jgi:hypothetical protein